MNEDNNMGKKGPVLNFCSVPAFSGESPSLPPCPWPPKWEGEVQTTLRPVSI